MNHVTCIIQNDRLVVYRNGSPIGYVLPDLMDEPVLTLYKTNDDITLSFNDFDIIQDNWNHFLENKSLTSAKV